MSQVIEMLQRAKQIHDRLMFPPNAVPDLGIDLKRKPIPPEAPPTPPQENLPKVIEYPIASCNVQITTSRPEPKTLKIRAVIQATADHFGITVPELMGESRIKVLVYPRHICFYIAKRHCKMSVAAIGRRFNRDHTSIMHGIRKIERLLPTDKVLESHIQMVENWLLTGRHDVPHQHQPAVAAEPKPNLAQPGEAGLSGC